MLPYRLDYTIEKVLKNNPTHEQNLLKQLTGKFFAKEEALRLWKKVENHKWLLSEKLGRDIGVKVAAIDYFENIHKSPSSLRNRNLMTYTPPTAIPMA